MTILPIYLHPHPILRQRAAPVKEVDDTIRQLLDDMVETMHNANGVGLSAPQVGIAKRVIVLQTANDKQRKRVYQNKPLFMINPEIVKTSKEKVKNSEGCLSIPTLYDDIARPRFIEVAYLDEHGHKQVMEPDEGLFTFGIQHEIDHLNGVLFPDHLSRLKREMVWKRYQKILPEILGALPYPCVEGTEE
jgi:peptide deformylase